MNANGSFTFTPPAAFTGATSFTYRAVNGFGPGNTATVTLTVSPPVPTTGPETYSTPMGTPLNTPAPGVLGNDLTNGGGALSAQLVTTTTNGILTLASDGSFSYAPNAGFRGADSFTYRAVNSVGPGNTATVSINVTEHHGPAATDGAVCRFHRRQHGHAPLHRADDGPAPTGYVIEGGIAPGEVLASIPTGSAYPIYTFTAPTGSFYVRVYTLAGTYAVRLPRTRSGSTSTCRCRHRRRRI